MRTPILCLLAFFFLAPGSFQTIKSQGVLIPGPRSVQALDGHFILQEGTRLLTDGRNPILDSLGTWFCDLAANRTGIRLEAEKKTGKGGAIRLALGGPERLGDEGYRLVIRKDGIDITGCKPAGVFYGLQTLLQMLPFDGVSPKGGFRMGCTEIEDQPAFRWRGMLLDCGRSFMEKDFVKRYIDLLAMLKMNRFHWHLTEDQGWRIEIKKYPLLTKVGAWRTLSDGTRYGGFYTQDDIREVVEYARQRFITVVPEIEMPGHCVAALAAYPQLSCTGGPFEVETRWGVFKDIYCAGNDEVLVFLKNVLDEVLPLFPSEYIHIGGDEVPKYRWENCPKCQARITSKGLHDAHELQSWFIAQINDYLTSRGRKLIGWDEILEGGLVSGVTVQSWRGFEGAMAAARAGCDAIVSPTSHAYLDYDIGTTNLERVYSFDPVPYGLEPEFRHHILGGECNLWTERAPQELVDGRVFPRILAMTEVLWTYPAERNFARFRERVMGFYPRLNALGVKYGYEKQPVAFQVQTDYPQRRITVELVKGQEESTLRYSLDGSEPTPGSARVEGPLVFSSAANLKVGAFLDGRGSPDIFNRQFEVHKAFGKKALFSYPFSPNYASTGPQALTDGQRGTNQFRDNLWLGFEGQDLTFDIDLGEVQDLNEVLVGFLQSVPSWIFYPEIVNLSWSSDGSAWSEQTTPNAISWKDEKTTTQDYRFKPGAKGRFLRIFAKNIGKCPDWHPGAGGKTWLFVDEVVVK